MKRVIRLTESELNNIIKKVLKEQERDPDTFLQRQISKNPPLPPPEPAPAPKPQQPREYVNLSRVGKDTKAVQEMLATQGYDLGPKGADGYMGPYTENAIKQFQKDNGKIATGKLTMDEYRLLQKKSFQEKAPKDTVRDLQQALVTLGYKIQVDGLHGPRTAAAIKHFQTKYGINPTGHFDSKTISQIKLDVKKKEAKERGETLPPMAPPTRQPAAPASVINPLGNIKTGLK